MSKQVVNDGEVKIDLDEIDEDNLFKPGSTMDKIVKRDKARAAKSNSKFGSVPDKLVRDLTNDERALLIKNYTDGVENDNFNVKQLKSGNMSITRKRKGEVKTLDDVVAKTVVKSNGGKVGNMTNEQMLIQNMLEIERKLERERLKRKRLQKKYKKMKSDIYEDDGKGGDDEEIIINQKVEDKVEEKVEEIVVEPVKEEPKVEEVVKQSVQQPREAPRPTLQRKMTVREMLLLRAQQYSTQ